MLKQIRSLLVLTTIAACSVTLGSSLGCSALSRGASAAADAAIDCTKVDLSRKVREDGPGLLFEVLGVVQAGGDGWRDTLMSIGSSVGDTALACAVQAAKTGLESARRYSGADPAAAATERAAAFIIERRWTFR